MVFKSRYICLVFVLLFATSAFATNYQMKFNPQTGRGDWVVADSSLGGGLGAPTNVDYLVVTPSSSLSNEVVVGSSTVSFGGLQTSTLLATGSVTIDSNSGRLYLGANQEASIYYDGTNLEINHANVAFPNIPNCDTIDTDAFGVVSCGTDDGAGVTAWDDVEDPDADTTIALGGYETVFTSSLDEANHTVLKIDNTVADLTNDIGLLNLELGDTDNGHFIGAYNNNGDLVWLLGPNGKMTIGAGATDYILPVARGAAGQVLQDNGGGAVTFVSLDSDDLSDVASIAMLNENETVTGTWYFDVGHYILRSDDAWGGYLNFQRNRDGDPTSNVADNDQLGNIYFNGYHTSAPYTGATIRALVDGTPGESDMPSRIEFLTSVDGSDTPVLRGSVDSAGDWKFGDGVWTNYLQISSGGVLTLNGTAAISAGVSGNAGTATSLETARTIAGVSFNGTANIAIASTGLSDTADLLYEAELDAFNELQSQIADKTLVNEEDAVAFDVSLSVPVLTVSTSFMAGDNDKIYLGDNQEVSIYFDNTEDELYMTSDSRSFNFYTGAGDPTLGFGNDASIYWNGTDLWAITNSTATNLTNN